MCSVSDVLVPVQCHYNGVFVRNPLHRAQWFTEWCLKYVLHWKGLFGIFNASVWCHFPKYFYKLMEDFTFPCEWLFLHILLRLISVIVENSTKHSSQVSFHRIQCVVFFSVVSYLCWYSFITLSIRPLQQYQFNRYSFSATFEQWTSERISKRPNLFFETLLILNICSYTLKTDWNNQICGSKWGTPTLWSKFIYFSCQGTH